MSLNPENSLCGTTMVLAISILILSVVSVLIPGSGVARAGDVTLEQRVRRIEDEKDIRDLIMQYGQYLDTKNFTGYSQLFAREGTWSGETTRYVPIKGPEAIRTTMEKAFAERVYDPDHITNLHLITNVKINIEGDRATGYCKWTVMSRNDSDKPYIRLTGHYDDIYIREDGRWRFLSRVAKRDIP